MFLDQGNLDIRHHILILAKIINTISNCEFKSCSIMDSHGQWESNPLELEKSSD